MSFKAALLSRGADDAFGVTHFPLHPGRSPPPFVRCRPLDRTPWGESFCSLTVPWFSFNFLCKLDLRQTKITATVYQAPLVANGFIHAFARVITTEDTARKPRDTVMNASFRLLWKRRALNGKVRTRDPSDGDRVRGGQSGPRARGAERAAVLDLRASGGSGRRPHLWPEPPGRGDPAGGGAGGRVRRPVWVRSVEGLLRRRDRGPAGSWGLGWSSGPKSRPQTPLRGPRGVQTDFPALRLDGPSRSDGAGSHPNTERGRPGGSSRRSEGRGAQRPGARGPKRFGEKGVLAWVLLAGRRPRAAD